MTESSPSESAKSAERFLLDVNVLVALCLTTHIHHASAHAFLARAAAWATTPLTEAALFRLLLNPAVTGLQTNVADVTSVVGGFRHDPRWHFLVDDSSLAVPVVATRVLTGHQQVTDLHLVNLARNHRRRLATFDRALPGWLTPDDRAWVHVVPSLS